MSITEIIIFVLLGLLFIMNVTMMYLIFKLKENYIETKSAEKLFRNIVEVNNQFIKENTDTAQKIFEREETMVKLVDATNECYEVFKKQNKAIVEAFHKASKNYDQILKEWEIAEERYSEIYEQYDEIKERINDISGRLPYTRPITITPYTSPITITPPPAVEPGLLGYEITCNTKGAETVNE